VITRVKDLFTGVNGTALASHTPNVGGPWDDIDAGWEIQGNKCQADVNEAWSSIDTAGRTADIRFNFDLNGMEDASDLYVEIADDDGEANLVAASIFGTGEIRLFQIGSGVPTSILVFVVPSLATGVHAFRMLIGPGTVSLFVDGVEYFKVPRFIPATMNLSFFYLFISASSGTFPILDDLLVLG